VIPSPTPSLCGRYSASSLLRTSPPPSRLRSTSRWLPVIRPLLLPPISRSGRGRFLQLLGWSLLSCRLYHAAGVMHLFNQSAMHHAAFAPTQGSRPQDLNSDEATM
jgi:hypothetical protein